MKAFPSQEALSGVIGAIYDCALDPDGWEATLELVRRLLRACNAQLGLVDLTGKRILLAKSVGIEPCWLERQAVYHAELTTWQSLPQALLRSPDEPLVSSRDLPGGTASSSTYVAEWCAPQGIVDSMGIMLLRSPERQSQLALGRHHSEGLITGREIRLGRLLAPHLRRAVTISNILDARSLELDTARQMFDSLEAGVVLTDGRARILHANAAAEAMLRAGETVRSAAGVLQAGVAAATVELHRAITLAAGNVPALGGIGAAIRLTGSGQIPAVASVLPLNSGGVRNRLEPRARAAVFISSVDARAGGAELLGAAFGLTRSETRLLGLLLAGRTLVESAAALGIARTTAKTHLEGIFIKTDVTRQADLLRLMSRLGAQIGRSSG